MYVYIVKDLECPEESERITGVFLDPLNAETHKIQYGYSQVEKHLVTDSEQIREKLKSAQSPKPSRKAGPGQLPNPLST